MQIVGSGTNTDREFDCKRVVSPTNSLAMHTKTKVLSASVLVKPEGSAARVDAVIAEGPTENPMFNSFLLEAVLERNNMQAALKRVKKNKGAPGIDGMTVEELVPYLREFWPGIR